MKFILIYLIYHSTNNMDCSRFYDSIPSDVFDRQIKGSTVSQFVYRPIGNYNQLFQKYESLLKDDEFRDFVVKHDITYEQTPSACSDDKPIIGMGFGSLRRLLEDLHSGKGMTSLTHAMDKDGFVVLKDEWNYMYVYYTNPDSFHKWMSNPTI